MSGPGLDTDLDRAALIAELEEQDRALRFDAFGHADAYAVGVHAMALAEERDLTLTVALWLGEQLVFHAARAGTSADNDSWMRRKAAIVRRFDASSQLVRTRWAAYGVTTPSLALGLDPAVYTFSGGAVPIRIGATQVGVAVASGVNDEVEHALVIEALGHRLSAR